MVSVRTVLVFVVTFSYLDSVLSLRDRELRTSSWCPEVGLGILLIRLRCPEVELGISLFKKSLNNEIPKPTSGHLRRNQNDQRSTKTKS